MKLFLGATKRNEIQINCIDEMQKNNFNTFLMQIFCFNSFFSMLRLYFTCICITCIYHLFIICIHIIRLSIEAQVSDQHNAISGSVPPRTER